MGESRDFKGNGTVSSPKTCCIDKKVPEKCLGMCTKRRPYGRGLKNIGTCKTYWKSIKTCGALGEEGKMSWFIKFDFLNFNVSTYQYDSKFKMLKISCSRSTFNIWFCNWLL